MDRLTATLAVGVLVLVFGFLFALLAKLERGRVEALIAEAEARLTREINIQKAAIAVLSKAIVNLGGNVTPQIDESTGKWTLSDEDEDDE